MVQSRAASVDDWMAEVEPDRREAIGRLRALCRESLTGWTEGMAYGMPGYGPEGADPMVSFNSQKRHIALYVGAAVIERFKVRLGKTDCGKGCIRYSGPKAMDFEVIADMLSHIRAHGRGACG